MLLFLKQFKDFLILFLAAGAAWYADRMVDVYVILSVIMFNAVLGFFQEYRAEKAIQVLRSMIKQQATVLRGLWSPQRAHVPSYAKSPPPWAICDVSAKNKLFLCVLPLKEPGRRRATKKEP